MDKRWKATERRVAQLTGGARVPITGRARGMTPDVAHPLWAIECKDKKTLPAWLHTAMAQARAAVRGTQVPVVILHQAGQRHANDLVVLRLEDFIALHGAAGLSGEAAE